MRMTEADKTARRRVIASVLAEAVERRRIELVEAEGRSGRPEPGSAGEAVSAVRQGVSLPSR